MIEIPSGKVHTQITAVTTPLLGIGIYKLTNNFQLTTQITLSYAFSGLMFSGDLDLHSIQSQRWSILSFIWWPYRKMFSHRSFFTHDPIIGTIVRLIYLFIVSLIGVTVYLSLKFKQFTFSYNYIYYLKEFFTNNLFLCINIFLGLILGALSHTASDEIVSFFGKLKRKIIKKFKKKKKRRR